MLSLKDFNPKPYEPDTVPFATFPEVIRQEVALTHPELVVLYSHPALARLCPLAYANERDWFVPTRFIDGSPEVMDLRDA